MQMLNYENFVDYCKNSLLKVLGDSYESYQTEINVSDVKSYDSLAFRKKDAKGLVLSYRMEGFFMDYRDGLSLGDVILKMLKLHEDQIDAKLDYSFLNNISEYDIARYRLIIRAINFTNNEKLLQDFYYKQVGDIALVIYTLVGEQAGTMATAKIDKDILEKYNMPFEQIYENALQNTARLFTPVLQPVSSVFESLFKKGPVKEENYNFMDPASNFQIRNLSEPYVFNTTNGINGATALFFPGVLPRLAKLFNDDLLISFTSIHEAMIHSAKYMQERAIKKLASEMRKAPGMASDGSEFLTANAYKYSKINDELKVL